MDKLREALERIADPRNTHFAGDAQVVAREALAMVAEPPPLSEDLQQIIYAIERSARTLECQADELHAQRDYSAGLPAADAESLRKAVALLKGCRFGAEG